MIKVYRFLLLIFAVIFLSCSSRQTAVTSNNSSENNSESNNEIVLLHLKYAELKRSINHYLFFFSMFQNRLEQKAPNRFNFHFTQIDKDSKFLDLNFNDVVESDFKHGNKNFIMPVSHMEMKEFLYFSLKVQKMFGVKCVEFHFCCTDGEPYDKWIKSYNDQVRKKLISETGKDILAIIENDWEEEKAKLIKR